MSKTIELAKHLEKLHINNMYKSDFYWTWDKTDEELEAIFTRRGYPLGAPGFYDHEKFHLPNSGKRHPFQSRTL